MMKNIFLLSLVTMVFVITAKAQINTCNKSAKVDKLVKAIKIKENVDMGEGERLLNNTAYKNLNPSELLYYCFAYPEKSSQLCDVLSPREKKKNIYTNFYPDNISEYYISERQSASILKNQDTIVGLLKSCFAKNKKIDNASLSFIYEADLIKAFSIVIDEVTKNGATNNDAATLLISYMQFDESYKTAWGKTSIYKKIGDNAFLKNTLENRNLIIASAQNYIKFKLKK